MDIDNSRTYTIDEAAQLLGRKRSGLRDAVTAGTVPHGRHGKVKGVYFTADHLHAILLAQDRPALPAASGQGVVTQPAAVALPAKFANLRSARS